MGIAELTGDGDAMAYRAGADISGKEFPDLHVNIAKCPVWKGNGEAYAVFWNYLDGNGNSIPLNGFDLAMVSVIHAGKGPVMWNLADATDHDIEEMDRYVQRRGVPQEVERVGLPYHERQNVPIIGGSAGGATAEQTAGLWATDHYCSSTIPGLFSAGDSCCTWAWGAINRLGPPGLLPAAVTGKRAAQGALSWVNAHEGQPLQSCELEPLFEKQLYPLHRTAGFDPRWSFQQLQNIMLPYYVLHIKHGERLQAALANVSFLRSHVIPKLRANDAHELRLCHELDNMALNAEMMLRSSLARKESRGWHYREDFPVQDDENWLAWVVLRKGPDGMIVEKKPIPKQWLPRLDPDPGKRYEKKWFAWDQKGGTHVH